MPKETELETLFVTFMGRDEQLEATFNRVEEKARAVAKSIHESIGKAFTSELFDDASLNQAFDKVTQAAAKAATAVTTVVDAQAAQVETAKAAAADVGRAVSESATSAARASEAAADATSKVTDATKEAADAAGKLADETSKAADSGGDFAKWADEMLTKLKDVHAEVLKEQEALRALSDVQLKVSESGETLTVTQEELNEVIKSLATQVNTQRQLWAARVTSDQQFQRSTRELRQALLELVDSGVLTEAQLKRVAQSAAFAQRGLDSAAGVASRGGLAWTAQIALANQFGQSLKNLGPIGQQASQALGLLQTGFKNLQAPLSDADFSLGKLGTTLASIPGLIATATAALTIGLGAALVKASLSAAKTADEIDKAAKAAGFTAEAFQEVAFALTQSGMSVSQVESGLKAFNQRLGQAATGTDRVAAAYQRLGVSVKNVDGSMRSSDSVFTDLVTALSKYEDASIQAALAGDVFGKTLSRAVIPMLQEGADSFDALRQRAREMGLVISGDTIMSLTDLKGELDTLGKQFSVAKLEIAAAFLPIMRALVSFVQTHVVPWVQALATRVDEFSTALLDTTEAGAKFRQDLAQNLRGVILLGKGVVASAQLVTSAVNAILATGAGAFGAGEGARAWMEYSEHYLERRRDLTQQIAMMEAQLQEPWAAPGTEASVIIATNLQKAREELATIPASMAEAVERGRVDAMRGLRDTAESQFQAAMSTLQMDVAAQLDALAVSMGDSSRSAFTREFADLGDIIGDSITGGLETLPEGSLAYAEAAAREAAAAFARATDDEMRAAAKALQDYWEGVAAEIRKRFGEADILAGGRLWTSRLEVELREGAKSVQDVTNLILPEIDKWRAAAASAFTEFGWDSNEYRDAITKLEFLEGELERLVGRPRELRVNVTADVTPALELGTPEFFSELSPVMARFLELLGQPATAAMSTFRTNYGDFAGGVALATATTTESLNTASDALNVWMDTLRALDAAGASLEDRMAALAKSPFAGALMLPPGAGPETGPALGLLEAAYERQRAAFAALQKAMTEEAIREEGARYDAATAEVTRLEALYKGTDVTPDFSGGEDARLRLNNDLAVLTRTLVMFGQEADLIPKSLGLIEAAITSILRGDPTADVQDLLNTWTSLKNAMGEAGEAGVDLTRVQQDLAAAQARLAQLAGTAPSEWDELRAAFLAAADAAVITREQLEDLLRVLKDLEAAGAAAQALARLTGDVNIGADIAQGLATALTNIQLGDVQGALSGLTQLGTAIGMKLGGPAGAALVSAIGGALQAAVSIFQWVSDLFTGDSPARRKLRDGLASAVANGFRTGIMNGLRGAEGWRDELKQNVKEAVLGALVDAFIQAAVMQAIFAPFIDEFTKILNKAGIDAAFDYFDTQFEGFWAAAMQIVEGFVSRGQQYFKQVDVPTPEDVTPGRFDLPSATVTSLAAPAWALELTSAAQGIREAGEQMLVAARMMQATFNQGIPVTQESTRGIDAMRSL